MASNRTSYQSSWNEQSSYKPSQWKPTVSAPTCAFCQKTVFPAEEVTGAGQKFHKLCLKCGKVFLRSNKILFFYDETFLINFSFV